MSVRYAQGSVSPPRRPQLASLQRVSHREDEEDDIDTPAHPLHVPLPSPTLSPAVRRALAAGPSRMRSMPDINNGADDTGPAAPPPLMRSFSLSLRQSAKLDRNRTRSNSQLTTSSSSSRDSSTSGWWPGLGLRGSVAEEERDGLDPDLDEEDEDEDRDRDGDVEEHTGSQPSELRRRLVNIGLTVDFAVHRAKKRIRKRMRLD